MRGVVVVLLLAAAIGASPAAAAGPPASNQFTLTQRESARLVAYASALRTCLTRAGVDVGRPHATRKQISLAVSGAASGRAVVQAGLACAERIGDPPRLASLQTFADRIVLYLPKQCLLDKKVVREVG